MRLKKIFVGISANILILSLVSFINDISSEMILPILPIFIVTLGGTGIIIGLVGGLEESLAGIFKIVSGYYSDRIRKRKRFIFLGYFISSVSKILLPLSSTWEHVLGLRPADRVGKGIRTAPRDAAIADSSPKNARGKSYGFHRAFDTLGAVVGSFTVLILIFYSALTLNLIILIAAIIGFVALIPILAVKDTTSSTPKKKVTFHLRDLPKELIKFYVASGLFSLANFSYMFYILYVTGGVFGSGQLFFSIFLYTLFTIVYAIFSYPSGLLADKMGKKKVLTISFIIFSISSLVFLLSFNFVGLILGFILYGLFNALYDGPRRAFTVDLSPEELRGTTLGTLETIISILALISSIFAGLIFDLIAPEAIFIYSLILSIVAVLVLQFIKIERETDNTQDQVSDESIKS